MRKSVVLFVFLPAVLPVRAQLNNDKPGNSGSSETLLNDNMRVRVFSEGVPAYEEIIMIPRSSYA